MKVKFIMTMVGGMVVTFKLTNDFTLRGLITVKYRISKRTPEVYYNSGSIPVYTRLSSL